AYAMFSLAERLHIRNEDMDLYKQLLEEARWGLNWIMKTSFRNGYRNGGSISSRRTNGIIGDFDDLISTARNTPLDHFVASAVEGLAFRVLKNDDPRLANYALKMAEEDWGYAIEGMAATKAQSNKSVFRGTFDSDNVEHEVVSLGIRASVDLWKATGNQQYREKAAEWAKVIVNSQQQRKPDWDIPITGFFYTSPAKEHILHYCHRGREQAPILALTALCEAFPDHPDWMNWYSSIALHSEYLKTVARYTEPFGVFPASIYSDQEYLLAPDSRRESFRKQVLNGIPLGKGHYLRLFPVWMDYRGHFGTILPQAKALASAGHLRGDLASAQLAQHQLEWVIGRNPFSQSNMWGEGYDFPPLYTPLSGDMVGGLPVGIQTRGDHDVPYWPVQNSWTYKEIWGYPVTSWISLMRDLSGPALVEGFAESEIKFKETTSGQTILINPELNTGKYRILLPQGTYQVRCGEIETT
ncbi:MAG: glycoside hydrolase family 9 protein, partial [Cyclobacteriaceae bacterium]|nr:glycoside hydrolase family 9 protein [Cyclobacteriaceae bacterium]